MSKDDTLRAELRDAVSPNAPELEEWLGTRESQEVGQADGDVTDSRWRCSLMSWGHDPLR